MQLTETKLAGVYIVDMAKSEDERGFFARSWDPVIAKEHGLQEVFEYTCISTNDRKHTLRGMHSQRDPHGEVKLVRCTKGAIFDVALDLRPDSPTFKKWCSAELTSDNHQSLYIPQGYAHGFLTLEDDSEVLYHISGEYVSDAATGARFDDSAFNIEWPASPQVISERDAHYPDFQS